MRWDHFSDRWRSLALTYRVSKYPSERKLKRKVVDKEIEKAFAMWSNVTDLTFTNRHYGPVHIELSFEKRWHHRVPSGEINTDSVWHRDGNSLITGHTGTESPLMARAEFWLTHSIPCTEEMSTLTRRRTGSRPRDSGVAAPTSALLLLMRSATPSDWSTSGVDFLP